MKKTLMIISERSDHLIGECAILRSSGVELLYARNKYEVEAGLQMHSPAFALLDFDIEGVNFLLKKLVLSPHGLHPYIMVAAHYADSNERAHMLRRGADFCVEKPINEYEVLAVIDAVFRRVMRRSIIRFEELVINTSGRIVTMRGKPVALTRKEYEVLCLLACHAGTVLTKEEIYQTVWRTGETSNSTHVSDQISSLRAKLGLSRKDTTYIHTVIGVGYRFGEAI